MAEDPVETLRRWEAHGAVWRARWVTDTEAAVDLCSCTGERVDRLQSSDPALVALLRERPRSDAD